MRLRQFTIEGLGHLSALIADEAAGVAAVVDPRRDVDVYLDAAKEDNLRITHVVETHLHNDYVSGGRELAALTGATHVIGAGAELRYDHHPLRGGGSFEVGSLRFDVLDTPGHTPEHVVKRSVHRMGVRDRVPGAKQVGPANRADEQRSSGQHEQRLVRAPGVGNRVRDVLRGVPGRVEDIEPE